MSDTSSVHSHSSSTSSGGSHASDDTAGTQYTKVSHEDHVLIVPDTYVGSIESEAAQRDILVETTDEDGKTTVSIENKLIQCVPALYKIFDEVLVNAADHWKRLLSFVEDGKLVGTQVTEIRVSISQETGEISVWNDGDGIDVVYLDEYEMYPPELIFGSLLTGTNYNQSQAKIWGGRNGYGAKLANIFSLIFKVETLDAKRGIIFSQIFRNNMKDREEPVLTKTKSKKAYTKISFTPDYAKFGLDGIDDDTLALFKKRVYDIAAWTDTAVSVSLNGSKIKVQTFEKYVDLYLGTNATRPRIHERVNSRWEIVASYSDDDAFQQVSFVNGICTFRGGKHIDYLVDQIKDGLVDMIAKRKKITIKPASIKNQLSIFVKATVENPSFDSQTKETMTTAKKNFGSTAVLSQKFLDALYKTSIIDKVLAETAYKNSKTLQKTDGKKQRKIVGIPKLCDANKAGGKDSLKCTLILTEGDSAKTTAVSGLSVVGRDHWGVFPLRGKLLNVKDVSPDKVGKNEEINNLKKILGLKNNQSFDSLSKGEWPLRYGKILIMTDQDLDGSHIKGLVMNLFHTQWHSLLQHDFITTMVTPIVKVMKGGQKLPFYNLTDYHAWQESVPNTKGWNIKYYKGLGTSTTEEAKSYFRDLQVQTFKYDPETSDVAINLAFDKTKSADRKDWLKDYDANKVLDAKINSIGYSQFIHEDLIHFSHADCLRSIPDVRDGHKPSQRKIMYSCFKKGLKSDIKVAQLAGYVSENASYHHGEVSLMGAIISLAQTFVGSNNVNLLFPSGQFGTRLMGGKDAASPRYIFTRLSKATSLIYRTDDFGILKYLDDEGFSIEPVTYLPIIPMILVNGTRGIGTGHSTNVPCHCPIQIIDVLVGMLDGDPYATEVTALRPWYRGFTGEIEEDKGTYSTHGKYVLSGVNEVRVTELPVGMWTQNYKEYLDSCIKDRSNEKSKKTFLKSFDDYCTESTVDFRLKLCEPHANYATKRLRELLKMKSSMETNTRNMVLYDSRGKLRKFRHSGEIIEDYFDARIKGYVDRRLLLIRNLMDESNILEDRVKFIQGVLKGSIDLRNKPSATVDEELEAFGLRRLKGEPPSFDYLTDMKMSSLTLERVEALLKQWEDKKVELANVEASTPENLWKTELIELRGVLVKEMQSGDEKKTKVVKKAKSKK